ncbi:MAG: Hsp20/alpha crystallin family protein [Methanomicrobiales archaeon]|nr:Hsp20/alpha crystallin family protein [Methanomicrobiales archaeon]
MPDNLSPDDIFRHLMKMLEELAGQMGSDHSPHFIGYTIVSAPGEPPRVIRITNHSPCELLYELVEGPRHVYITLELPSDMSTAPEIDFDRRKVVIQIGSQEMVIDLPTPVDILHCSYQLRHGVMDVVCLKA